MSGWLQDGPQIGVHHEAVFPLSVPKAGPISSCLANRPDLIWVDQLEQLEAVATALLHDPALAERPVVPPTEWPMHQLLKRALGPAAAAPHTLA